MKALVTGAAGFIGSHLVTGLHGRFDLVIGADRRPMTFPKMAIDGDLLTAELPAVDAIFHLAGQPGVRQSWDEFDRYLRDNLAVTQRLLEHARETGARFVYASSSSVYGEGGAGNPRPVSPYGVTKLAVEHLCDAYHTQYGVRTIGLRYFTVYGPRQRPDMAFHRFIDAALAGRPVNVLGDGQQSRWFTHVDDVVHATVLAAYAPSGVYDVAGPGPATVSRAISLIETLTGRTVIRHHHPAAAGDPFDPSPKGTRLPGYRPSVLLEDGLATQVAAATRPLAA